MLAFVFTKQFSFHVVLLLSTWAALVLASASRGQLLALPLYLFLGAVVWRRLPLKRAGLLLLLGGLFFLPVAEVIRVQREGDATNPALRRTFETFRSVNSSWVRAMSFICC